MAIRPPAKRRYTASSIMYSLNKASLIPKEKKYYIDSELVYEWYQNNLIITIKDFYKLIPKSIATTAVYSSPMMKLPPPPRFGFTKGFW